MLRQPAWRPSRRFWTLRHVRVRHCRMPQTQWCQWYRPEGLGVWQHCALARSRSTSDLPWVASPMIADDLKIHVFFFFKGDTRGFHKAGNSGFSRVCHWCFAMWRCLRLCWFQNYVLGMAWQMWASNHAWVGWLRGSPEMMMEGTVFNCCIMLSAWLLMRKNW